MSITTLTDEIIDSFVYETMGGQFMVTDPTEFDQVIPGGPWNSKEEAVQSLTNYINQNEITFE
jgi:hypothetical protein